MFASLLRHARCRKHRDHSDSDDAPLLPGRGGYRDRDRGRQQREPAAYNASEEGGAGAGGGGGGAEGYEGEGEDEDEEDMPLLPLFSSEYLDRLPVYHDTHAIRLLVVQRCETTLSWDQLRSPQISQFLVKPIQQRIQSNFSRATLFALMSNCLQFQREGRMNPGNIGVSKTRAMICELLAMRLLKEFSTRELIDALSYDFDPLQGFNSPGTTISPGQFRKLSSRSTRISTIEVAIRAQAKKFLAHPLVVQQLEAIWAGTIVFHNSGDYIHRRPETPRQVRGYGAIASPATDVLPKEQTMAAFELQNRRTVILYDPHDSSIFKLSRLRVPRYRQLFSTISFAIMLCLFLAVLSQKSLDITTIEVIFWFWSAGFMLDEIVGFTEQGFGLYIMSVWNAIDLGILLLFVVYYVLRLYGILMPDVHKAYIASMAYDVLASTAVLLFPRAFSVLDHYRYFSQLLIAFRMMAMDLVAIMVLIIIACSGFFVAFTLSFSDDDFDAGSGAYALFQLLMGFTPTAWQMWGTLNPLGKTILTLFLFICHFLIVTILITVLTNSFMAVVQNGNEEHQYLFAINTLSMVKSDALFSYIAPTNIIGWLLTPLRYVLSFRRFVRLNRTVIKITHLPVLLCIFVYERLILSHGTYEPTDLVEQRGREPVRVPAFSIRGPNDMFSPGTRLREPSITTFQKDRALEEVFRRPFNNQCVDKIVRDDAIEDRRKTSNVVRDWMRAMGPDERAESPAEQPRSVIERLETRRPRFRRAETHQGLLSRWRTISPLPHSIVSEPEERFTHESHRSASQLRQQRQPGSPVDTDQVLAEARHEDQRAHDGDDEFNIYEETSQNNETTTNDGSDKENESRPTSKLPSEDDEEFFRTPLTAIPTGSYFSDRDERFQERLSSGSGTPSRPRALRPRGHQRHSSTNTVLFSPAPSNHPASRPVSPKKRARALRSGTATPGNGRRTPKRSSNLWSGPTPTASRPRTAVSGKDVWHGSEPSHSPRHMLAQRNRRSQQQQQQQHPNLDRLPSFNAAALDLASDLGDNKYSYDPFGTLAGGIPASFDTQLELAAAAAEAHRNRGGGGGGGPPLPAVPAAAADGDLVGRLVLARMSTLEEGFREVIREVKELKSSGGAGSSVAAPTTTTATATTTATPSQADVRLSSFTSAGTSASAMARRMARAKGKGKGKGRARTGPSSRDGGDETSSEGGVEGLSSLSV